MPPRWYAWKSPTFIYDQPRACSAQINLALSVLDRTGQIPLDDKDAHIGALTLLKDHMKRLCADPPALRDIQRRIREVCRRPGFDPRAPECSHCPPERWVWIDPSTIAHGWHNERFKTYHYSVAQLARLALRVVNEDGDPDGLFELFGEPREIPHGIVVNSYPGPVGPIRVIAVNGNHRSIALEALGAPLVVAAVANWSAPYRCQLTEEDDWRTTLDFLRWLEIRGVVRLSPRPVIRDGVSVYLRIAEAMVPWLAASPGDALSALDVYERFHQRSVTIKGLDLAELRREWAPIAKAQRRWKPRVEKVEASSTMVLTGDVDRVLAVRDHPPRSIAGREHAPRPRPSC